MRAIPIFTENIPLRALPLANLQVAKPQSLIPFLSRSIQPPVQHLPVVSFSSGIVGKRLALLLPDDTESLYKAINNTLLIEFFKVAEVNTISAKPILPWISMKHNYGCLNENVS